MIIIISPIHGFNYPKITLDFICCFPKGDNKVILMNTRAGMKLGNIVTPGLTGIAFILSSFILRRKGYKIIGQIPLDMPSNWISIHPALSNRSIKFVCEKNYYRTKEYCDRIFAGESVFIAYRDIVQDILISPIAFAYYLIGRFVFAKSYYAAITCDNCGRCIRRCPVKAIKRVNKRPFWTLKCESCMKCMNHCPKKAIETAHGLFMAIGFITLLTASYITNKVLPFCSQSGLFKFGLYNILFTSLLFIFYAIQYFVLRYKFIGKIISLTSLTHYKFWGRYKL